MKILWSRIALAFVGIFALIWFIPQTYYRVTRGEHVSFTSYFSPVSKTFITRQSSSSGISIYFDDEGNKLTRKEVSLLLPFLFRFDLQKWNKFPITIDGVEYSFVEASKTQISYFRPRVNLDLSLVPVVPLFESRPHGAGLELPNDFIVLGKSAVRFVNADTGYEEQEKAQKVNDAILASGATFPFKAFASNPSALKPFDEGVWVVDAQDKFYQIQWTDGKPKVRNTGITAPKNFISLTVEEDPRKEYYGLVIATDAVYLNTYEGALKKLPIKDFNAYTDTVSIWVTPTGKTITVNRFNENGLPQAVRLIATTPDGKVIREKSLGYPQEFVNRAEYVQKGLSFISPVTLTQLSPVKPGVLFEFKYATYPVFAFAGGVFWAILYACVLWVLIKRGNNSLRRKENFVKENVLSLAIICFLGLPALVAILLAGPLMRSPKKEII